MRPCSRQQIFLRIFVFLSDRFRMKQLCVRYLNKKLLPPGWLAVRYSSKSKKGKKFSETLNLPKTEFPISMRNIAERESTVQKECKFENLYNWQREHNSGKEFILHDGPPYANGHPHVGHALNKILKDITNRYHVLQGNRVHYVSGWDCHGMPIELKALEDAIYSNQKLTPLQIRDKARRFAQSAIYHQMQGFKRWGVMSDWNNCYYTYDPQYQTSQLDVFYNLFQKGLVYIDFMPVYWSPSTRSALAESELEYNNEHVSNSVYLRVPVMHCPSAIQQLITGNKQVYAVIWTTTPWSLPANQAICYGKQISYCILEDKASQDVYICEDSFADKLVSIMKKDLFQIATVKGSSLSSTTYSHPLTGEVLPFLAGSHVTANKGTGLVHTAPAHGHDDFQLALAHSMKIKNLLDATGAYTDEAGYDLAGRFVTDTTTEQTVLQLLGDKLIHIEKFTHSYPYDWRTKKPVIIAASRQWFIDTDKLKEKALECIKDVEIKPSSSENSMLSMLQSRPYWCISRQRVWGVPIPVFYHKETEKPLINRSTFEHVRQLISQHGSDCWWSLPQDELLPTSLLEKQGLGTSEDYIKGEDILDIWFDSGTSWMSVLPAPEKQADIYMEGVDQYGGWFQSSLLTSVALRDKAPYKKLVVHGFVRDEDGKKMSKSVGNVIDPEVVVNGGKNKNKEPAYGADVLRWWVAMSNLQFSVTIGANKLNQIHTDLYDMRKTLRYLLGNVSDMTQLELLKFECLWPQDKYILYQLYQYASKVSDLYEDMEYTKILQNTLKFLKDDVSAFYTTLIKDRCYCGDKEGLPRYSSQTAQFYILDTVTKALAPIIPHMTEELYLHYPKSRRKEDTWSLFQNGWFNLPEEWNDPSVLDNIQPVLDIREHLSDLLVSEPSMEFDVMIYASSLLYSKLQEFQSEHTSDVSPLCEMMMTASTSLTDKPLHVIPEDVQTVDGIVSVHMKVGICGLGLLKCEVIMTASDKPLHVIPEDVQTVDGIVSVHMKDGYTSPEQYVLIMSSSDKSMCPRCRRFTAETSSTPCTRCLSVMAEGLK